MVYISDMLSMVKTVRKDHNDCQPRHDNDHGIEHGIDVVRATLTHASADNFREQGPTRRRATR